MPHGERLINMKVLLIDDELTKQTANGHAVRALVQELRDREVAVVEATSADDGRTVVLSDPSLEGILLDWTLSDDDTAHDNAKALINFIRSRNTHIPVFLMAERGDAASLTMEVMRQADELIWILEDTIDFIAGRIIAAASRYREAIVPPLTKALIDFARGTRVFVAHTRSHGWYSLLKVTGGACLLRLFW